MMSDKNPRNYVSQWALDQGHDITANQSALHWRSVDRVYMKQQQQLRRRHDEESEANLYQPLVSEVSGKSSADRWRGKDIDSIYCERTSGPKLNAAFVDNEIKEKKERFRPYSARIRRQNLSSEHFVDEKPNKVRPQSAKICRQDHQELASIDPSLIPKQIQASKWTEMMFRSPSFQQSNLRKLELETYQLLQSVFTKRKQSKPLQTQDGVAHRKKLKKSIKSPVCGSGIHVVRDRKLEQANDDERTKQYEVKTLNQNTRASSCGRKQERNQDKLLRKKTLQRNKLWHKTIQHEQVPDSGAIRRKAQLRVRQERIEEMDDCRQRVLQEMGWADTSDDGDLHKQKKSPSLPKKNGKRGMMPRSVNQIETTSVFKGKIDRNAKASEPPEVSLGTITTTSKTELLSIASLKTDQHKIQGITSNNVEHAIVIDNTMIEKDSAMSLPAEFDDGTNSTPIGTSINVTKDTLEVSFGDQSCGLEKHVCDMNALERADEGCSEKDHFTTNNRSIPDEILNMKQTMASQFNALSPVDNTLESQQIQNIVPIESIDRSHDVTGWLSECCDSMSTQYLSSGLHDVYAKESDASDSDIIHYEPSGPHCETRTAECVKLVRPENSNVQHFNGVSSYDIVPHQSSLYASIGTIAGETDNGSIKNGTLQLEHVITPLNTALPTFLQQPNLSEIEPATLPTLEVLDIENVTDLSCDGLQSVIVEELHDDSQTIDAFGPIKDDPESLKVIETTLNDGGLLVLDSDQCYGYSLDMDSCGDDELEESAAGFRCESARICETEEIERMALLQLPVTAPAELDSCVAEESVDVMAEIDAHSVSGDTTTNEVCISACEMEEQRTELIEDVSDTEKNSLSHPLQSRDGDVERLDVKSSDSSTILSRPSIFDESEHEELLTQSSHVVVTSPPTMTTLTPEVSLLSCEPQMNPAKALSEGNLLSKSASDWLTNVLQTPREIIINEARQQIQNTDVLTMCGFSLDRDTSSAIDNCVSTDKAEHMVCLQDILDVDPTCYSDRQSVSLVENQRTDQFKAIENDEYLAITTHDREMGNDLVLLPGDMEVVKSNRDDGNCANSINADTATNAPLIEVNSEMEQIHESTQGEMIKQADDVVINKVPAFTSEDAFETQHVRSTLQSIVNSVETASCECVEQDVRQNDEQDNLVVKNGIATSTSDDSRQANHVHEAGTDDDDVNELMTAKMSPVDASVPTCVVSMGPSEAEVSSQLSNTALTIASTPIELVCAGNTSETVEHSMLTGVGLEHGEVVMSELLQVTTNEGDNADIVTVFPLDDHTQACPINVKSVLTSRDEEQEQSIPVSLCDSLKDKAPPRENVAASQIQAQYRCFVRRGIILDQLKFFLSQQHRKARKKTRKVSKQAAQSRAIITPMVEDRASDNVSMTALASSVDGIAASVDETESPVKPFTYECSNKEGTCTTSEALPYEERLEQKDAPLRHEEVSPDLHPDTKLVKDDSPRYLYPEKELQTFYEALPIDATITVGACGVVLSQQSSVTERNCEEPTLLSEAEQTYTSPLLAALAFADDPDEVTDENKSLRLNISVDNTGKSSNGELDSARDATAKAARDSALLAALAFTEESEEDYLEQVFEYADESPVALKANAGVIDVTTASEEVSQWERYLDVSTNKSFYYNPTLNISQWTAPENEPFKDKAEESQTSQENVYEGDKAAVTLSTLAEWERIRAQSTFLESRDGWDCYLMQDGTGMFYYHPERNDYYVHDAGWTDESKREESFTTALSTNTKFCQHLTDPVEGSDENIAISTTARGWEQRRKSSIRTERRGDWQAFLDEASQQTFYYNAQTGESTWDAPTIFLSTATSATGQCDWVSYVDEATGVPYYVNLITSETSWEEPPGFLRVSLNHERIMGDVHSEQMGDSSNVFIDQEIHEMAEVDNVNDEDEDEEEDVYAITIDGHQSPSNIFF